MSQGFAKKSSIDDDVLIAQAINEIYSEYGVRVSVDQKKKSLLKFGENEDVSTSEESLERHIDAILNETYINYNGITTISSGSTADVMDFRLEGHYVGDDISVSSLTQSSGVATCVTSSAHGFSVNQYVNIRGANETEYNGVIKILSTPTSTSFTYSVASGATSPATGTILTNHLNKTFSTQDISLNGQNQVTLSQNLARSTRGFPPEQNQAFDLTGPVYVYENDTDTNGKPDTDAGVHLVIGAGENQSDKAATSLSSTDWWIITGLYLDVLEKTSGFAVGEVRYRKLGGVFRPLLPKISASNSARGIAKYAPYRIAPANSDVTLIVSSSATIHVSGGVQGFLARTIG